MLTNEVAAKLNLQLFDRAVRDAEVNALIEKIRRDGGVRDDAFLDVYQLGFSSNRLAVPELVKLSTSVNEYVRLAAVSSLGILKARDQFDFLVQRYETQGRIWQDRAMALKAIGDLDTAQSRAYLQKALSVYAERTDTEALWTREVIDLYLQ